VFVGVLGFSAADDFEFMLDGFRIGVLLYQKNWLGAILLILNSNFLNFGTYHPDLLAFHLIWLCCSLCYRLWRSASSFDRRRLVRRRHHALVDCVFKFFALGD
jgi:hypothetical protein